MSEHTPGPWFADDKGYIWRRPLSELYEYGGGVAGDKPLTAVQKGWFGENSTGYPVKANARLIAAAPELLTAMQELIAAHAAKGGPTNGFVRKPGTKEYQLGIFMAWQKIHAAIAKATGETE